MDNLLEAINNFYHQNGHYPKVSIHPDVAYSDEFYEELAKMQWNDNLLIWITETVDQWELE